MAPVSNGRTFLGYSQDRRKRGWIVLGTLGFALCSHVPAWAQEAAKPDGASASSPFAWLLLFLPALIVIVMFIPVIRRQKTQVNRSLDMSAESLQLSREQVVLQKQTNELLKQLIEKQSRF
jgi:hypothetical protein